MMKLCLSAEALAQAGIISYRMFYNNSFPHRCNPIKQKAPFGFPREVFSGMRIVHIHFLNIVILYHLYS